MQVNVMILEKGLPQKRGFKENVMALLRQHDVLHAAQCIGYVISKPNVHGGKELQVRSTWRRVI